MRIRRFRIDNDRAVDAGLLLKAGMAVIPVGAALHHRELVGEGLAGFDAIKRKPGYAVHLVRQQQAVPVNGAGFRQQVGDLEGDSVTFAPAQGWAGNAPVDSSGRAGLAGDVHIGAAQSQVKGVTADDRCAGMPLSREQLARVDGHAQAGGTQCQALHETSPRQGKRMWGVHGLSPDCLSG